MLKLKVVIIVSMMLNIYRPLGFTVCVSFTGDLSLPHSHSFLTEVVIILSKGEKFRILTKNDSDMCCKIISCISDNPERFSQRLQPV